MDDGAVDKEPAGDAAGVEAEEGSSQCNNARVRSRTGAFASGRREKGEKKKEKEKKTKKERTNKRKREREFMLG